MDAVRRRLTFGVIVDHISSFGDHEYFQSLIISGVSEFARQHDINVMTFVAGKLFSPYEWERSRNFTLDLVHPDQIDGIIMLTTSIGSYTNVQYIYDLLDRYAGTPIVTIGENLERYHSVSSGSYQGMKEITEHLIQVHHCRRMAFIRGPAGRNESEERYQAYQDALREHGIPLDPELVCSGNFLYDAGAAAIETLHRRGVEYDAIIAANDNMALGAMSELRKLYGVLPTGLPIVGYDDAVFAQHLGLTTVRQEFRQVAMLAAENLYKIIQGETVAKDIVVPAPMIVRLTCGCTPDIVANAAKPVAPAEARTADPALLYERLRELIRQSRPKLQLLETNEADHELEGFELSLVSALMDELYHRGSSSFSPIWNKFISWLVERGGELSALHDLISDLRSLALPRLDAQQSATAERLFHAARVQISDAIGRTSAASYYFSSLHTAELDQLSEELFVDLDIDKQMYLMENSLAKYGMCSCFIVLFDNPEEPMTTSRLVMAVLNGKRLVAEPEGIRFRTVDLLPRETMARLRAERTNIVVQALHHGDSKLGYAIFGYEHKINRAFEVIRQRLSIAIKSAILMTNVKNQAVQLEQQVAERTKELTETNRRLMIEIEKRQEAENQLRQALEELAVLNEDLRALSIRDELTGLYNRRGFMEQGGALMHTARSERLALLIMFADMDKLKTINDHYGHDEGDRAICLIASLLKSSLPVGSVISRLGGDEYTAIIPLARIEGAEAAVRERINKELAACTRQSGLPYTLSISMGFALFDPDRPATFNELIKQADDRQYIEKRKKRSAG